MCQISKGLFQQILAWHTLWEYLDGCPERSLSSHINYWNEQTRKTNLFKIAASLVSNQHFTSSQSFLGWTLEDRSENSKHPKRWTKRSVFGRWADQMTKIYQGLLFWTFADPGNGVATCLQATNKHCGRSPGNHLCKYLRSGNAGTSNLRRAGRWNDLPRVQFGLCIASDSSF